MKILDEKLNYLKGLLRSYNKITIAFSAGMDSTFLAETAYSIMPENIMLVNIDFAFTRKIDTDFTTKYAEERKLPYRIINLDPFNDVNIISNPSDRCYYCKKRILDLVKTVAEKEGFPQIIDGTNASDLGDFRPGKKAAAEFGVKHPLLEANITKPEIRKLARKMSLDIADKPSFSCYATRFPYGEAITPDKIDRVKNAENLLIQLGFTEFRVRSHNIIARIEVPESDFAKVIDKRNIILEKFKQLGYSYITLDMQGFRSGSMNEIL